MVRSGLDVLLSRRLDLVRGRRVGLVTNQTGVTADLEHGADALVARGVRVTALFGPEHGVRGAAPEGAHVENQVDPATGIPLYSLYGRTRRPTAAMLAGVDLLVVDLQDIGARFFTYPYTMAYVMLAARERGRPCIVLDRPNPIGGLAVEGPVLEPALASFVGLYPMPIRHGMTMGELARLFNSHFDIGCDLTVVPMAGWRRAMWWQDTGLPFVPMSPNTTGMAMATLYCGTCLVEGTELSEGRGTTRPFEWIGAPWAGGPALAAELNRRGLPGVRFRPVYFTPLGAKHAGVECQGVQVHVLDQQAVCPVATGLHLLDAFRRLHPDQFRWRAPDTPGGTLFFDLLAGTPRVREQLEAGVPVDQVAAAWQAGEAEFLATRAPYLLYD